MVKRAMKRVPPGSPLYAVGFSLGGMMLLRHLGRTGAACHLKGAMAVSPLMDMVANYKHMSGLHFFYLPVIMAPLLGYLSNVLQIREFSTTMLRRKQRAEPRGAQDIGSFQMCCEAVGYVAVLTNSGLIFYTMFATTARTLGRAWEGWRSWARLATASQIFWTGSIPLAPCTTFSAEGESSRRGTEAARDRGRTGSRRRPVRRRAGSRAPRRRRAVLAQARATS